MTSAARNDKQTPLRIVQFFSALLYLALVLPTLEIVYRLYLFCIECHFQRNVNHADSVAYIWTALIIVFGTSIGLWLIARIGKYERCVVPVIAVSAVLLLIFWGMRAFGALVTYDEYILGSRRFL